MQKSYGLLREVTNEDLKLLEDDPDNFWSGVFAIGDHAFGDCSLLKKIDIPSTIEIIYYGAFRFCNQLEEVNIEGDSLEEIGNRAFEDCHKLKLINIPSSVKTIGDRTFCSCKSLKNINLPNGLTHIGNSSFSWCGISEVEIPSSVVSIGNDAFSCCKNLERISMTDSVTSLGESVFSYCKKLENVRLSNSLKDLKDFTFSRCYKLTDVNMPTSITSIGDECFFGCKNLEKAIIPDTVESIGNKAFSQCTKLKELKLSNTLSTINDNAFEDCTSLNNVYIPDSVNNVSPTAFQGCNNIQSFSFLSKLPNIMLENSFRYIYADIIRDRFTLSQSEDEGLNTSAQKFDFDVPIRVNKNMLENCKQLTQMKSDKKIRFFPHSSIVSTIPNSQIKNFYIQSNLNRWKEVVNNFGFNRIPAQNKFDSMKDLFSLYYSIGGFSSDESESVIAHNYILEKVLPLFKERELESRKGIYCSEEDALKYIAEDLHTQFTELKITGPHDPTYAKFFMKYYHENPNFMVHENDERDYNYLCGAHNAFNNYRETYPHRIVEGNTENELITPEHIICFLNNVKYENIHAGNEKLATMVAPYGFSQEEFDIMQRIIEYTRENKPKQIINASNDSAETKVTFRVLDKEDEYGFIIGKLTNCCQYIGGAARTCVREGYINPNSGFLVFESTDPNLPKERKLLGQAYVWYDPETKTLCYDNIEVPTDVIKNLNKSHLESQKTQTTSLKTDFLEAIERSAKNIMEKMRDDGIEVNRVTIGEGWNDFSNELKNLYKSEYDPIAKNRVIDVYSDAQSIQFIVFDQTSFNESYQVKNDKAKMSIDSEITMPRQSLQVEKTSDDSTNSENKKLEKTRKVLRFIITALERAKKNIVVTFNNKNKINNKNDNSQYR